MAVAAALPAVMSIGSAIVGGIGARAGANSSADASYRAAQVGRARAQQIDLASRQELQQTLGNIMAIRASAGGDVNSPTSQALLDRQQQLGEQSRMAKVSSENIKADQLERQGKAQANAGNWALAGGIMKALPGFGSLFGSIDFSSFGQSSGLVTGGGASP